jgi:hypothetical protein
MCNQWSTPNQPDPLVGLTVGSLTKATTIGQALQDEWSPVEVQAEESGWDWW